MNWFKKATITMDLDWKTVSQEMAEKQFVAKYGREPNLEDMNDVELLGYMRPSSDEVQKEILRRTFEDDSYKEEEPPYKDPYF